jgi:hypothetical protein
MVLVGSEFREVLGHTAVSGGLSGTIGGDTTDISPAVTPSGEIGNEGHRMKGEE